MRCILPVTIRVGQSGVLGRLDSVVCKPTGWTKSYNWYNLSSTKLLFLHHGLDEVVYF